MSALTGLAIARNTSTSAPPTLFLAPYTECKRWSPHSYTRTFTFWNRATSFHYLPYNENRFIMQNANFHFDYTQCEWKTAYKCCVRGVCCFMPEASPFDSIHSLLFISAPWNGPGFWSVKASCLMVLFRIYLCRWCDMAGQTMPNHPGRRYISRHSDPVGGENIEFWLCRRWFRVFKSILALHWYIHYYISGRQNWRKRPIDHVRGVESEGFSLHIYANFVIS